MKSISEQIEDFEKKDYLKLKKRNIFKSENLFMAILGLNLLETRIFAFLLKNKDVSTSRMTQLFQMDRSSIQRALKTLIDMELIKRKSMSLKQYSNLKNLDSTTKRGYLYAYNALDIKTIQKRMINLLDKWYESMANYIHDLDSLFDCYEEDGRLC